MSTGSDMALDDDEAKKIKRSMSTALDMSEDRAKKNKQSTSTVGGVGVGSSSSKGDSGSENNNHSSPSMGVVNDEYGNDAILVPHKLPPCEATASSQSKEVSMKDSEEKPQPPAPKSYIMSKEEYLKHYDAAFGLPADMQEYIEKEYGNDAKLPPDLVPILSKEDYLKFYPGVFTVPSYIREDQKEAYAKSLLRSWKSCHQNHVNRNWHKLQKYLKHPDDEDGGDIYLD